MRILALDPGPQESAWVILSDGKISSFGKHENRELSKAILDLDTIDQIVIEMIASYGMPVGAEVFETCVWIGRFIQAFGESRCHRITRIGIKNHLCHSSKAKDANIRQALIDRMGPPGTKKNPGPTHGITADAWAALAVAVTWYDQCMAAGLS